MSDFRIHSRTRNYRGGFSGCYGGGRKDYIFLSPSAVNSSSTTDASFSAFTDSPVREDLSVVRLLEVTRRQSAATRSPADIISISPGTTFAAGILSSLPFLSTQAWGDDSFFKASRLFRHVFLNNSEQCV